MKEKVEEYGEGGRKECVGEEVGECNGGGSRRMWWRRK